MAAVRPHCRLVAVGRGAPAGAVRAGGLSERSGHRLDRFCTVQSERWKRARQHFVYLPDVRGGLADRGAVPAGAACGHGSAGFGRRNRIIVRNKTSVGKQRSLLAESASSMAYYSVPMFFRIPLSILAIPIYTRYLTPADYGIMELLDLTSLLIAALIGSNFGHSLYYYYAEAKTEEGKAQCISAAYYGSLFLTALGGVVGLAARGRSRTFGFRTERD